MSGQLAKVLEFPADRIARGLHGYYPEMGDRKPNCQMEASMSYDARHYYVKTPLELTGRGITHTQTYTEKDFPSGDHRRVGWHVYRVTPKAFKGLKERYSVSMQILLD